MRPRALLLALVLGFAPWSAVIPVQAQEPEPEPPVEEATVAVTPRELLDAIREDLVALRFEKALAALEPLLSSPSLTDDERVEAMVLRSQTRAAFGDLDATVEDYRQILLRRPGWSPDPSLTPQKALKRFESVRDEIVGRVRFVLDPADAVVVIDGKEMPDTLEPLPLLSGTHALRVARRGHDPVDQTLEVVAGESVELKISLVPNARTVILRTEPEDVEVWLDGKFVGKTAFNDTFVGVGATSPELVIEDVPLGEHRFEFRKECRRTEKFVDSLNVDLLDRAPRRYDTVRLAESFVVLTPAGGPAGTELRIDGAAVATLPAETVEACPGPRDLEAVFRGRVLWSETRTLVEGVPGNLTIRARPNLLLVGLDELPRELAGLEAHVNLRTLDAAPSRDYSQDATWERLDFAAGTDLALAPSAASRQGTRPTWWLYSPVLRTLNRLDETPRAGEPAWVRRTWGLGLADDDGALVVERADATSDGPAVGSRLVSVDGKEIGDVAGLRAALDSAAAGRAVRASWVVPDGTTVEGQLLGRESPWLQDRPPRGVEDAIRAAWAVVVSESGREDAASALANLALIFGAHGEHELASRTWGRVDWPQRAGIGPGTVDYYLGRALQALGRDREAIEALRRAANSAATAGTHDGPAVAPAARDRLADLGEAP